jgi:hypothetical protein
MRWVMCGVSCRLRLLLLVIEMAPVCADQGGGAGRAICCTILQWSYCHCCQCKIQWLSKQQHPLATVPDAFWLWSESKRAFGRAEAPKVRQIAVSEDQLHAFMPGHMLLIDIYSRKVEPAAGLECM